MYQVVFYRTASGNDVVQSFLRNLPSDDKKVVGADLKTLQFGYPIGMPLCRSCGPKLMELRSSLPSKRELRLLWFFDKASQQIVVVHAFIKKTQKTPNQDRELGEKRRSECE